VFSGDENAESVSCPLPAFCSIARPFRPHLASPTQLTSEEK